jgi:hypothetical protein
LKQKAFIMMNSIERNLSRTENVLSSLAAIPIIGTVPAVAKVAMGTVQTITALFIATVAGLPAAAFGNKKILERSWTHIKNGIGNIAAGAVEAIPLVGTGVFIMRFKRAMGLGVPGKSINLDTQELKWLSYPSLSQRVQRQMAPRTPGRPPAPSAVPPVVRRGQAPGNRGSRRGHRPPAHFPPRATPYQQTQDQLTTQWDRMYPDRPSN